MGFDVNNLLPDFPPPFNGSVKSESRIDSILFDINQF